MEGGRQYWFWGLKQLDSMGFYIASLVPGWESTPSECALELGSVLGRCAEGYLRM